MNTQDPFNQFQFNRFRLPGKIIAIFIAAILFIIIWRLLNPNIFFWIGLFVTCILVWAASFGWRKAIVALVKFLNYLNSL